MRNQKVMKLTLAGLMAALCYVGYAVFPAINASGTKVHLGNAFVVLGALLLGGPLGGLSGAVGLSLADILTGYADSSPRTFITKLVIGLIVGLVAHRVFRIGQRKLGSRESAGDFVQKFSGTTGMVIASVAAGLGFNCVFEPALKYVWYTFLFANAEKADKALKALLAVTAWTTLVNAVINGIAAVILYLALRPVLEKMHLDLPGLRPVKKEHQ